MPELPRSFHPGGPWTYLKIYCGETAADRLLRTAILPLIDGLERYPIATHWFFVRYVDPEHHLRIRFHVPEADRRQDLLARVTAVLDVPIRDGFVWRTQVDTYEREIERYGAQTMELCERLFHRDSEMVVRALALVHEAEDEDLRWRFALVAMQKALDDLEYGAEDRLRLLVALADGLLQEHGGTKTLRLQLDARFRERRGAIEAAIDPNADRPEHLPAALLALIEARSTATGVDRRELLRLAREERLEVPLAGLIGSYLHMFCNRLFPTRQRLHELVLYTFLAKHLRGVVAREAGAPGEGAQLFQIAQRGSAMG
jgi:lantibiotic biosynthesis protein